MDAPLLVQMNQVVYLKKGQEDPVPFKLYECDQQGGRLHVSTIERELELAGLKVLVPGDAIYLNVAAHDETGLSLEKFMVNTKDNPLPVKGGAMAQPPQPYAGLPATEKVVAFVYALPDIGKQLLEQREQQQRRGRNGQLPVRFPHPFPVGMTSDSLLVRDDYWALWDTVQHHANAALPSQRQRGFVITGSPGTGKSTMAFVVMALLAADEGHLVYEADDGERWYMDFRQQPPVVRAGDKDTLKFSEEMNETCWHLVDKHFPSNQYTNRRRTLVFISPKPRETESFCKTSTAMVLYMPLWSVEELCTAADILGLGLTHEEIEHRYGLWGGCARRVFNPRRYGEDSLARIVRTAKPDDLLTAAQLPADETNIHTLVHYNVQVDGDRAYEGYTLCFASRHVGNMLLNQWQQDSKAALRALVCSATIPSLAGLRGFLFEGIWHCTAIEQSEYDVRQLVRPSSNKRPRSGTASSRPPPAQQKWELPAASQKSFMEGVHYKFSKPTYLTPVRRNQPAFDSLLFIPAGKALHFPKDTLLAFQCTVSQSHTIHWSKLVKLDEQFYPKPQRVCVVYVVPHDVYPSFKWAGEGPPPGACVEEWVLCVQLRP